MVVATAGPRLVRGYILFLAVELVWPSSASAGGCSISIREPGSKIIVDPNGMVTLAPNSNVMIFSIIITAGWAVVCSLGGGRIISVGLVVVIPIVIASGVVVGSDAQTNSPPFAKKRDQRNEGK